MKRLTPKEFYDEVFNGIMRHDDMTFDFAKAYADHCEESAWVSVEERLPDNVNSQPVLVLVTDGSIATTGYYLHDRKSWSDYRMKITHWRPFPTPPGNEATTQKEEKV